MIDEIADFFHSFKKRIIEADELVNKHASKINEFNEYLVENGFNKEYEENFLIILAYTQRLEDISQRVYFTFQEAVYAIDLDKLMKNEDSEKLNSIVYVLVLKFLIDEYKGLEIDKELKSRALEAYKKVEESKHKEDKKYHMYQY